MNWNVVPLQQNFIVWLMNDTNVLLKPIINEALRGDEPMIIAAGSTFNYVDMTRMMIMNLCLSYMFSCCIRYSSSFNVCVSEHNLF